MSVLARPAARLPLALRLATRDLARHQARSAAVLAAVTLALGVPVTVVLAVGAAIQAEGAGNLSDHQLLVTVPGPEAPFIPTAAVAARAQDSAGHVARAVPGATVTGLDTVIAPGPQRESLDGRLAVSLARPVDGGWSDVGLIYLATPALLARHGLGPTMPAGVEFVIAEPAGDLHLMDHRPGPTGGKAVPVPLNAVRAVEPGYTHLPLALVAPEVARARGWEVVPSGSWLIEMPGPVTDDELSRARDAAATVGLTVESRNRQEGLAALRWGATATGVMLALTVLAMLVGVLRGESAGEVRTLTAVGAPTRVRRLVTATTAGTLGLLGGVLGTAGAYLVLVIGYVNEPADLGSVPVPSLLAVIVGLPALAAVVGGLLAGAEPSGLDRRLLS